MTFKGFKVLKSLLDQDLGHMISFVCIGNDSAVEKDYSQEITDLCLEYNLCWYPRGTEISFKSTEYEVAISWRWLIESKKIPLIVLHDSVLPKYRGFAPLVNALKNHEEKIGVTALLAREKYDTGPIILQEAVEINYPIKIQDAIEIITPLYVNLVTSIFKQILNGDDLNYIDQNHSDATYSLWLDNDDYYIDWSWSAGYIERFVNATGFPYTGAKTKTDKDVISIEQVEVVDDVNIVNRTPGKVIFIEDNIPVVVCGEGLVKIVKGCYSATGKNLLPFKKFRTKFQ